MKEIGIDECIHFTIVSRWYDVVLFFTYEASNFRLICRSLICPLPPLPYYTKFRHFTLGEMLFCDRFGHWNYFYMA